VSKPGGRSGLRRDLGDLIQTCESIESRKFNPFLLDVSEALQLLRLHAERLSSLEDHLLDMKAITGVANVVGLQSAHLRFQSTSIFIDPEMARSKIDALARQQLAEFFLLSWHPIVELEQLNRSTLSEAMRYWEQLLTFFERRKRLEVGQMAAPGIATLGDLSSSGIVEDKAFAKRLHEFWEEMKRKTGSDQGLEYWEFVRVNSFAETVTRAQFVSFLVTYGFAIMEKKGERIVLTPRASPQPSTFGSPVSLPIAIKRGT